MSYAAFDAIKIGIASPEQILAWSYGEVSDADDGDDEDIAFEEEVLDFADSEEDE